MKSRFSLLPLSLLAVVATISLSPLTWSKSHEAVKKTEAPQTSESPTKSDDATWDACLDDLDRHCKDANVGEDELVRCLAKNEKKLSAPCKKVLKQKYPKGVSQKAEAAAVKKSAH